MASKSPPILNSCVAD